MVVQAVGCGALPVGGSGGAVWLRCCGVVYDRVGDACGCGVLALLFRSP